MDPQPYLKEVIRATQTTNNLGTGASRLFLGKNLLDQDVPHLSHRRPGRHLFKSEPLYQSYINAARVAKSKHFIHAEELCPRQHCSRCLGQTVAQEFLIAVGLPYEELSMESAAAVARTTADQVLENFKILQRLTDKTLSILQVLKPSLGVVVESCFQGISRRNDLYGCMNLLANTSTGTLGFLAGDLVTEDISHNPDIFFEFLAARASNHPASFMQQQEAAMQHAWDQGWWLMFTSKCLLLLDEANFGNVQEVRKHGLHTDGVYTYIKGNIILDGLSLLYQRLAAFEMMVCTRFDGFMENNSGLHPPDSVVKLEKFTPKPLPILHDALEVSNAALKSAMLKLKDVVFGSMTSGKVLSDQYEDRLQWGVAHIPEVKLASDNDPGYEAFHNITFDRIYEFGALLALIQDVTRLQKTAQAVFRRSKTKTDLFAAWETAESSVNSILKYLGGRIIYGALHTSPEDANFDPMETLIRRTSTGRVEVAPRYRTFWTVLALQNSNEAALKTIDQFLAYFELHREKKRLLHWTADYVLDLVPAIRQVVVAMQILQPLSSREYQYALLGQCNYEAEARKVYYASRKLVMSEVFQRKIQRELWSPLGLKTKPAGSLEQQYHEIWDRVIETVTQAYKGSSVSPKILADIEGLLKARDSAILEEVSQVEEAHLSDPVASSATVSAPSTQSSKGKGKDKSHETAIAALGQALRGFDLSAQPPPRVSQWGDKSPSPKKKKKQKEKTRGVPAEHPDPNAAAVAAAAAAAPPIEEEPLPEPTPRIVFADGRAYLAWRNIFPVSNEASRTSKLRWEDLCALLTGPPLDFMVGEASTQIFKFHRSARRGWPEGVVTLHKPHGANPKLEKKQLDNIRKDLRREFGWMADDFELEEQAG